MRQVIRSKKFWKFSLLNQVWNHPYYSPWWQRGSTTEDIEWARDGSLEVFASMGEASCSLCQTEVLPPSFQSSESTLLQGQWSIRKSFLNLIQTLKLQGLFNAIPTVTCGRPTMVSSKHCLQIWLHISISLWTTARTSWILWQMPAPITWR